MTRWSADKKLMRELRSSVRKDPDTLQKLQDLVWSQRRKKGGEEPTVTLGDTTYKIVVADPNESYRSTSFVNSRSQR